MIELTDGEDERNHAPAAHRNTSFHPVPSPSLLYATYFLVSKSLGFIPVCVCVCVCVCVHDGVSDG